LPIFYRRYVNDCFTIFKNSSDAKKFLNFINSLDENIQFTLEESSNKCITFLDTEITLETDNSFKIDFHIKSTNTGVYTPQFAYAPEKYKLAAIRSLLSRAFRICSDQTLYESASEKIIETFIGNGFQLETILKVKKQVEEKVCAKQENKNKENDKKIIYWSVPFIREGFKDFNHRIHKINQKLSKAEIQTTYSTCKMKDFFRNKDKIVSDLRSDIVYQYNCDRCPMRYIGATKRHFYTRISEHLRGYPTQTEVSMHVHAPKHENFKIIGCSKYPMILESILINNTDCLSNDRNGQFPLTLNL